jgi:DNA polymerase-3 subunit delta
VGAEEMTRDLAAIMADIKSGRAPQLLLLFGDDLRVQEACKAIVDRLVPESERGFNLERFDGHTAGWDQIEVALMTPPLLPGKKVVWVEDALYFTSREQKGELGEKVLELWSEGKKDEASKLLADLLLMEGWTQDQWEQLQSATSGALAEMLGVDDETREQAESLLTYCKSKGVDLSQRRGSEGHRLLERLDKGLPEWDVLLLTAVQVDRRTRLYKRLEELQAVLYLGLERDRSGKVSRETLLEFVYQRIRQAGKHLQPGAREMILLRSSGELRSLQQELEKLVLFVGDQPSISAREVEMIFADQAEGWIFDLTRAIADRDAVAALSQLARLTAQGEHPLKLLGTIAAEARRLLSARQLLETQLRRVWKRGMTYQQFQQQVLEEGMPLLTRNAYADYMCFQRADSFELGELRAHMAAIHEADFRLKSSGSNPRLVMERLILGMCLGAQPATLSRGRRAGI